MDDIGGVWRTVGGRRVFIRDGEDLETAMINSGKFKIKNKGIDKTINKKLNDFFNNRDNINEHLIMFNDKGDTLQEVEGDSPNNVGKLSTVLKVVTSKKNSLLIAHNHPNNTSFSRADIITFNRFKSINSIVVVTNDKIYTLQKNGIGKIKTRKLKSKYDKIKDKLNQKNGKKNRNIALACEEISKQLGWRYEIYER